MTGFVGFGTGFSWGREMAPNTGSLLTIYTVPVAVPCALLHTVVRVGPGILSLMLPRDQDDTGSLTRVPRMLEGDIVVTRVARHYALGRMR